MQDIACRAAERLTRAVERHHRINGFLGRQRAEPGVCDEGALQIVVAIDAERIAERDPAVPGQIESLAAVQDSRMAVGRGSGPAPLTPRVGGAACDALHRHQPHTTGTPPYRAQSWPAL